MSHDGKSTKVNVLFGLDPVCQDCRVIENNIAELQMEIDQAEINIDLNTDPIISQNLEIIKNRQSISKDALKINNISTSIPSKKLYLKN